MTNETKAEEVNTVNVDDSKTGIALETTQEEIKEELKVEAESKEDIKVENDTKEKVNESAEPVVSNDKKPYRLHIVLSGGGLKGVFQLAFFDELFKLWEGVIDYEIASVYGTSIGGIIAPLVANKKVSKAMEVIGTIRGITDIFEPAGLYKFLPEKLLTLRLLSKTSIFKSVKILNKLNSILSEDEWKVAKEKCQVVAWNLVKKQEEWFSGENLEFGIKATSALWMLVDPVVKDSENIYVDGGVSELFPVTKLRELDGIDKERDIILFVDCDTRKSEGVKAKKIPKNILSMMMDLQDVALEQLALREEELLKAHWDKLYGCDTTDKYYYLIRPDKNILENGLDINREKFSTIENAARIKAHLFNYMFTKNSGVTPSRDV